MAMSLLRHKQHSDGKQHLKRCVLGDCGRLAVTAWMWRAAVDCSRHEPQQPEKLGQRRLINAYDGWLAMMTRWNVVDIVSWNPPAHKVLQQGTTVLLPVDTCRQGQQACSQSSQPPSTNEVLEGQEWWGRTSTTRTPARQCSNNDISAMWWDVDISTINDAVSYILYSSVYDTAVLQLVTTVTDRQTDLVKSHVLELFYKLIKFRFT